MHIIKLDHELSLEKEESEEKYIENLSVGSLNTDVLGHEFQLCHLITKGYNMQLSS